MRSQKDLFPEYLQLITYKAVPYNYFSEMNKVQEFVGLESKIVGFFEFLIAPFLSQSTHIDFNCLFLLDVSQRH